jgi:nucleoside-diphosphate-sugar epimerase
MTILITGANGLIGSDLVRKLSRKHKIFGIYRTKNDEVKKIKNVIWIKRNLKKKFKISLKPSPKFIIHCAVDQKFSKKKSTKDYINSNISILKNIINYTKGNKVKLIINLSSVDVYGDIRKKFIDENYLPQNQKTYGLTKMLSEQALYSQTTNFINIRLPGVLCEPLQKKFNRPWLNNVFNQMKKNKNIFVYNAKGKFNNVIDTDEIVKFIDFLIKKDITIRDTFNFVSLKPIILKDIFNIAKKKLNSKSKFIEIKDYEKSSFYISTKKLEQDLQYKTQSTKNIVVKYLDKL